MSPADIRARIRIALANDNRPTLAENVAKAMAIGEMLFHDDNTIHEYYGR